MLTNKNVLIVDDIDTMRRVIASQLERLAPKQIFTANNGTEALRVLGKQRIDLILSDWNMPGMNGLDLLSAIRTQPQYQGLPFILVTAETERDRVAAAIAAGVTDLLVKPYSSDVLVARIERAFRRESGQRDFPPAATGAVPARGHGKPGVATILIVDDTPDNLFLLTQMFKEDYTVRIANNGEKALQICCSDDPPDLVLLDVMMPGMDGFEVASRMREHPAAEMIPVIFVTAMDGDDARLRGLELGAVDFVNKPVDPNILKPRVRNFLRYVSLRNAQQADYDAMMESARLREDVERITRHDMRAPLAGIVGLAQSIREREALSPDELRDCLRAIEESALQALDMVNLSAEIYRIETGTYRLDPQPIGLDGILERVIELARAAHRDRRIAIHHVPAAIDATGDAMLCHSIFHNLLHNACEASPEGGSVDVAVSSCGDGSVCVSISNAGAVPHEIRERFFNKFVTHGKQGGSGIGTYSARLLANAQEGDIALAVDDEKDCTTVTVTLPGTPSRNQPLPEPLTPALRPEIG